MINRQFAGYSIGENCYQEVEKYTVNYGNRVLIVGGPTALQKGVNRLLANIHKLSVVDIVTLEHECTYQQIDRVINNYANKNIDMIFAMGGGKACDTGKTIASKMGIPVFTFPTIVSNCAAYSAMTVIYKEDGSLDEFYFMDHPATHVFMDTDILVNAPARFLKAGIADTLAKYYEVHFSSRNDQLDYHSAFGREISNLCLERIQKHTKACLQEIENKEAKDSFTEITLTIIVNTGMVSQLVNDDYNCALAHSVCYGLDEIEEAASNFLHGELVGYGILVQCIVDQDMENYHIVRDLLEEIDCPTTLSDMGLSLDDEKIGKILPVIVSGPDMQHIPYPVNEQMVKDAMKMIEETR